MPLPTLSPATRKYGPAPVLIVNGTLVATYDRCGKRDGVGHSTRGIALIRNLAMTV